MTSAALLKKQEEQNAKRVRDLLRLTENKKCFDCPIKSPFFVNVTLSTFVCTRCSGLVREVGHRVKSISASTFTGPELVALELGGNGIASKIWLSCGYNSLDTPEPESDGEVRGFMRQKYYERKWLNYDLAVSHDQSVRDRIKELFTEDGLPKQQQRRRRSTMENNTSSIGTLTFGLQQNTRPQKIIPTSLDLASVNKVQPPTIQTAPLIMTSGAQMQPKLTTSNEMIPNISDSVPVSPLPMQHTTSSVDSFFADLAGLSLSDAPTPTQTQTQTPSHTIGYNSHQLQPTSGILTPTSLTRADALAKDDSSKQNPVQPTKTYSTPRAIPYINDSSPISSQKHVISLHDTDPYSALRAHRTPQNQQLYQQSTSAINKITPTSPSSIHLDRNPIKMQTTSSDPYAALRRLSNDTNHITSFDSLSNNSAINTMISQPINNTNWTSSPAKQQHRVDVPFYAAQIPLKQDNSYSKRKTDEWVQANLDLATGNDEDGEDMMTQVSSPSTSYSAASSIASPKTSSNSNSNKGNINDAFGDLDPLAAFKQNKSLTSTFVRSNP